MEPNRAPRPLASDPSRWERWRNRDHTQGSLVRSLFVLALPLLASSLVAGVLFQLTELAFLSRLGESAMASVVIVNQTLRQTVFMLLMGASFATQALVAGSVGAGRVDAAEHYAGQSLALAGGLSVVLMSLGGLFPGFLFSLPGPDPDFYAYGVPYLRLVFLLNFGLVGTLIFGSIMSGAGDTTTPLFVTLIQTAVAIFAEWVLVFGHFGLPPLSVRGMAIGAAFGQVTAMGLGLTVLFSGRVRVHIRRRHLIPDLQVIKQICILAAPPAAQMVGSVIMAFAFLRLAGEFGAHVQAAYAIGLRLSMIVPAVCFPLASACAILVGQALGAGDSRRAWRVIGVGLLVHGAVMWSFALFIFFFRVEIVSVFTDQADVIAVGSEYLLYAAGSFAFFALYFPILRSLQGAGDFLVPMAISLGSLCLITLPLGFTLARHTELGATGIWVTQMIGSMIVTTSTGLWMLTGRWTRRVRPVR